MVDTIGSKGGQSKNQSNESRTTRSQKYLVGGASRIVYSSTLDVVVDGKTAHREYPSVPNKLLWLPI